VLEGGVVSHRTRLVPSVTYIDPQLARIGPTETEARAAGTPIRVAKLSMDASSRAWEVGERRGMLKALIDDRTERLVGGVILGAEAGELLGILEVAMLGGLPYTALAQAIFAHPTYSEIFNTLFTDGLAPRS
jgi:pyruvate/2-oxoglutarate dehydrogenase complex dihydrolipoamide dehydrogenase (E3) component